MKKEKTNLINWIEENLGIVCIVTLIIGILIGYFGV